MIVEFNVLQDLVDFLILELVKWVQVLPNGTLQQERLLRNVGNALSENVEAQLADVDAVDEDLALVQLTESEQGLQNRRLASASPPHDTDLHVWLNGESEFFNAWLQFNPVLHGRLLELNFALLRPILLPVNFVAGFQHIILALKVGIVHKSLRGGHHIVDLAHEPDRNGEE